MRKTWLLTVLAGSLLLAFSACNTGGFTYPAGTQCPADWNPFNASSDGSLKLMPQQKPIFDQQNAMPPQALPAGTYNYGQAEIYFVERAQAPRQPLMIQLQENLGPVDGQWHPAVTCMRNTQKDMDGINFSSDGISKIVVSSDQSTITVTTRHFGWSMTKGHYRFCEASVDQGSPNCKFIDNPNTVNSPRDVFAGANSKPIDYVFFQNPWIPTDYEIRTHYFVTLPNGTSGDLYFGTHLNYSK
jgi:hypothetical protein